AVRGGDLLHRAPRGDRPGHPRGAVPGEEGRRDPSRRLPRRRPERRPRAPPPGRCDADRRGPPPRVPGNRRGVRPPEERRRRPRRAGPGAPALRAVGATGRTTRRMGTNMREDVQALIDPARLAAHLEAHLPGGVPGPLAVERHLAGHSNETFFLRAGSSEWVLRRPPRGAFLPTAHDVGREFRVLSALSSTPVRVPRPLLMCADAEVIGAPFYVMECVAGVVLRSELPEPFASDVSARGRIGEELVDALAELHDVDWRGVGL